MTLFFVFAGLILLLLTGIPIFAALGLSASAIMMIVEGDIDGLGDAVFTQLDKPVLSTIPLFVFMAQVMIRAKVIDDLYTFAHTVIGHVKGGLGVATVLACTIFAAISGSSVATALSIGSSAIPQMKRFGYAERDALGVVAAGGTLGILIPPSGPMILYAIVSEASIGALFLAGIIPGLMLALMFSAYCMIQARGRDGVIPPFLTGCIRRIYAAIFSFWAGVMPPMPIFGRSLL